MVTIEEYEKCKNSVVYFAKNYVKFWNYNKAEYDEFQPTDKQIETLENFQNEKLFLLNSCRRYGKSILSAIYTSWVVIFKNDQYVMVLNPKNNDSVRFLSTCKILIDDVKDYFKIEFKESSKKTLLLNNNSCIGVGIADGVCGCGMTPQLVIVEEVAFCNGFRDFFPAVFPIISSRSDSQLILTGTKNSDKMNLFYRIYLKSQNPKCCWKSQGIDWRDIKHDEDTINHIKNHLSYDQFVIEYEKEFPINYPVKESPLEDIFFDYDGKLRILCDEGLLTVDEYSEEFTDDITTNKTWFNNSGFEWFVSQEKCGGCLIISRNIREDI